MKCGDRGRSPSSPSSAPALRARGVRLLTGIMASAFMTACTTVESLRKPEYLTAFTIPAPLEKAYRLVLTNAQYCETPFARGQLSDTKGSIIVQVQENTGIERDWIVDLASPSDGATQLDIYAYSPTQRRELGERFREVVESGNIRQCKATL